MNILYKGETIKLHDTYQLDEFYTSDIPIKLFNLFESCIPYIKNDKSTIFEDMIEIDMEFYDDDNVKYSLYVSYECNENDDDNILYYLDYLESETNFRIREL